MPYTPYMPVAPIERADPSKEGGRKDPNANPFAGFYDTKGNWVTPTAAEGTQERDFESPPPRVNGKLPQYYSPPVVAETKLPGQVWTPAKPTPEDPDNVGSWSTDPNFKPPAGMGLVGDEQNGYYWVPLDTQLPTGMSFVNVPGMTYAPTPEQIAAQNEAANAQLADSWRGPAQDFYEKTALPFFKQPTIASGVLEGQQPWWKQRTFASDFVPQTIKEIESKPSYASGILPRAEDLIDRFLGKSDEAEARYDEFRANMPDIRTDPGLAPYYEDAKKRALGTIDDWASSKGIYGSSASINAGADKVAQLEAERANREADYYLKRLDEQLGWEKQKTNWEDVLTNWAEKGTGAVTAAGDIAGLADTSDIQRWTTQMEAAFNLDKGELDKKMKEIEAATGVDQGELARMLAGLAGSVDVQNMTRAERQDYFNNMFSILGLMIPIVTNMQQLSMGQGTDLTGSAANAGVAGSSSALNVQQQNANMLSSMIPGLIAALKGPGGGSSTTMNNPMFTFGYTPPQNK